MASGDCIPKDMVSADVYTLDIPADQFEDFTHWTASGRLTIEQTPEQREAFLDWMESYLEEHR